MDFGAAARNVENTLNNHTQTLGAIQTALQQMQANQQQMQQQMQASMQQMQASMQLLQANQQQLMVNQQQLMATFAALQPTNIAARIRNSKCNKAVDSISPLLINNLPPPNFFNTYGVLLVSRRSQIDPILTFYSLPVVGLSVEQKKISLLEFLGVLQPAILPR